MDAPAAGVSADVADPASPVVASAAPPPALSALSLATQRSSSTSANPSLLAGFVAGSRHVDTYPGLEESLQTPWPQNSCLGRGSYGVVRAFEAARGAKRLRVRSKQPATLPTVAVNSGVVSPGAGAEQSNALRTKPASIASA